MKKILALVLTLVASNVFAGTYSDVLGNEFLLNRFSPQNAAKTQLGTAVEKARLISQKCIYDASKYGKTTTSLKNALGQPCVLPNHAIIRDALVDILTAVTGGTTPQAPVISLGYTGSTTAFLTGTSLNVLGGGVLPLLPGTPAITGASTTYIKLAADQTVLMTVVGSALTAGKFNVHFMYQIGD